MSCEIFGSELEPFVPNIEKEKQEKELIKKIDKVLKKISLDSKNLEKNKKIIKKYFSDINYKDEDNNTLLHLFVMYSSRRTTVLDIICVIQALIDLGLDINSYNDFGDNFIQTAIKNDLFSEYYIYKLVILCRYKLHINHRNYLGNTILHLIMQQYGTRSDNIFTLYSELKIYKLDLSIKNNHGDTVLDLIKDYDTNHYDTDAFVVRYFRKEHLIKQIEKDINNQNQYKEYLSRFGKLYNEDDIKENGYKKNEDEIGIACLGLSTFYKYLPILVEKELSGKFTFNQDLYFYMNNYYFEKINIDRYELFVTSVDEIIKGCRLIGDFNSNLFDILKICRKNNIVLFIDNINEIYTNSFSNEEKESVNSVINSNLINGLKLIGKVKEDKVNEIKDSNLTNYIRLIPLEDYEFNKRNEIISNMLDCYIKSNNLLVLSEDTKNLLKWILIEVARKENIKDNNTTTGIRVVEEILDLMYKPCMTPVIDAFLNKYHIIYAIEKCDLITEDCKKMILERINTYKNNCKKRLLK